MEQNNEDQSNPIGDSIRKLIEDMKDKKAPDEFVILSSPDLRPKFETGELRGMGTGNPQFTTPPMDIRYSSFLEIGTAYAVPKKFLTPERSHRLDPVAFKRSVDEMKSRFERELNNAIWGRGYQYQPHEIPYRWQRSQYETLIQWGDRLQERGLFDDPAIRIEYQKQLWLGMLNSAKGFVVNVAGKAITVLKLTTK